VYAADLAHVHHAGFTTLVRRAAPGLLRTLRRAGIRTGLVVDLGCGSGVWARALTRARYQVLGLDASPAMTALARRHAPAARFRTAPVDAAAIPDCAAVTALGEVLGYARAPREAPGRLPALFRRVARALPAGGLFVFDLVVSGRPSMTYRTWAAGRDWAVLVVVVEDGRWLRRDVTTFRRIGRRWRRRTERHWVHVHRAADVVRALRRAGFAVHTARRLGGVPLPPRRLAFVARRAGAPARRRLS
jgi:SAM-dependent methyltransferase